MVLKSGIHKKISATAYTRLEDALAYAFWYKSSLERYVRTAFREHPEITSGVDFSAPKRDVSNQVIGRLARYESSCQSATVQVMVELSNMGSFPELERLEDSEKWLSKAQRAVAALKTCTAAYEGILNEQERLDAESAAHTQQIEVQRTFAHELAALLVRFREMEKMIDVRARGLEFEDFLNSVLALFDLEPRLAYSLENEQIDGAFSFDTDDYILEAKWTHSPVSREQADAFAAKVQRKGKNALGLIISINGISGAAKRTYDHQTPFMTMDGMDLNAVLEGRIQLDELLRRKKRHANETGECYFPVNAMF